MKVYLATSGEYSDYRVVHVFRNREDAEAYAGAEDVDERELCDGPVEMRTLYRLWWHPAIPDREASPGHYNANPWIHGEQQDYDGNSRHVTHQWGQNPGADTCWLRVEGWERDRVLKVYSEQRAQYLAAQQGVS